MHSLPTPPGTDPLTGVPFRRVFSERLAQQRDGAVLYVDLDAAALANAVLVFTTVDRVLVELAALLKDVVPPGAFVGRWTSDEFVVYVPDAAAAPDVAENLRSAVERRWCLERDELRTKANPAHHPLPRHLLTVSVGVAAYQGNVNETVRAAENACVEAKRLGRNRVVVVRDD